MSQNIKIYNAKHFVEYSFKIMKTNNNIKCIKL